MSKSIRLTEETFPSDHRNHSVPEYVRAPLLAIFREDSRSKEKIVYLVGRTGITEPQLRKLSQGQHSGLGREQIIVLGTILKDMTEHFYSRTSSAGQPTAAP